MIVTLQTQRVCTLEQVHRVAAGEELVDFEVLERASAYDFIRRALVQFDYASLGKADKGAVKAYLAKMTGLSRAQLTRLVRQYRESGHVRDRRGDGPARPFARRYTAADVRLLAEVDAALGQRCGPATRRGNSLPANGPSSPVSSAAAFNTARVANAVAQLVPRARSKTPGPARAAATKTPGSSRLSQDAQSQVVACCNRSNIMPAAMCQQVRFDRSERPRSVSRGDCRGWLVVILNGHLARPRGPIRWREVHRRRAHRQRVQRLRRREKRPLMTAGSLGGGDEFPALLKRRVFEGNRRHSGNTQVLEHIPGRHHEQHPLGVRPPVQQARQ